MSDIRKLSTDEDLAAFADIVIDAYPGVFQASDQSHRRVKQRLAHAAHERPNTSLWGLFRIVSGQRRLLGGMRLFDFRMNFLGTEIPAGGVGQVAVALEHRKEHVARELMRFYLNHCREQGSPLALLYAFRPDFYRKMGFGYATKMSCYRLDPAALPQGPSKAHVRRLAQEDLDAVRACYARHVKLTHGMIHKSDYELDQLFEESQRRIVGFEKNGILRGYLAFSFERGKSFVHNDLRVHEFVYETRTALSELLTYLHSLDDQIHRILLTTQDPSFHHLFDDPRNGSNQLIPPVYHPTDLQGVGLMYRVIDIPRILEFLGERDFGGQTCRLEFRVEDTFLPEGDVRIGLAFEEGRVRIVDDERYDAYVDIDVGSFSSLLAGTVTFERLYMYSLADISDPTFVDPVTHVFSVEKKPICNTSF